MIINPEMFIIPDGEKFFLYSPLNGAVLSVNESIVRELKKMENGKKGRFQPEVKEELLRAGAILQKLPEKLIKPASEEYTPTAITIIPTWDCNLRCLYCYSNAGESPREVISEGVARAGIDFIIKNTLATGQTFTKLSFHGGGEPLLHKNLPLVLDIVNSFKERVSRKGLKGLVSSATNGVISLDDLKRVVADFDRLNISLDGPEDVQNLHRPLKGGNSFSQVMNTIEYLESISFSYGIRTTISAQSVGRMKEITNFLTNISSDSEIHLEPLFECGRCKTSKIHAPKMEDYCKGMKEALAIARKKRRKVYYSGSELEDVSNTFCGATGKNFFLTPSGQVSTCLEVTRQGEEMSDTFIIGEYDSLKREFKFDDKKLERLRRRKVRNLENCVGSGCFAKYNCAGDCLAKTQLTSGDMYDTSQNLRCETNRALLLENIKEKVSLKK